MQDQPYQPPQQPLEPAPAIASLVSPPKVPPRRPLSTGGWVAWVAIFLLVTALVALVFLGQIVQQETTEGDASGVDLMQVELGAKSLVAQNNLERMMTGSSTSQTSAPGSLNDGCYEQRLCYTILRNEVDGAESALQELDNLDRLAEKHDFEPTENQQRLRDLLGDLFDGYQMNDMDSGAMTAEEQDFIEERLGYCGKLALLPEGTPRKAEREALINDTVYRMMGAGFGIMLAGLTMLVGFGVATFFLIQAFAGKLKRRFFASPTDHNVYAETFALWLVIFFGSSLVMGALVTDMSVSMMLQPVIFFGSLGCLIWPIMRGVSFGQMLSDIGWKTKEPITDICTTPFTYSATLPLLIPGFLFLMVAAAIMAMFQDNSEFARQGGPGHPIQEYLAEGNVTVIALVFLTACVAAPIVEETMFRGVLYRHLRDVTSHYKRWVSVAISAVLNGFIFASIHPQGIVAVPLLMTLAIGFSLAREWRGSLLTCVAMHAVHNTAITCVSLLIL